MLFIGIAGGTGSGKTTFANAIVDAFGDSKVLLIPQDSYYIDRSHLTLDEREKINFDHPESLDSYMLFNHLMQLRDGSHIQIPQYDFNTHCRRNEKLTAYPKPIVIVEGITLLADSDLRTVFDLKLFVDADSDVRVLRRAIRDINERSRTLESVHDQYLSTVKLMHEIFVEPSKKYADIIVPRGGHNKVALDLVTSWIEFHLDSK
ncbi:Uridine kinase [Desulfosporosinus sp. I2]|uniref:uridine kinase n=1 Tax=Desulfosporosinus sp. I2 TaxID=1617025 RepID=UPI0005EEE9AB|nr:uridine kinase [Desulfosporosinus sp. I2]KJR46652.1 Uridine kinase [Desulfosporosinus sp. I2]